MIDTLEEFRKQHMENYRQAILENIRNNSEVLVNEDIMSLLRKPPLDSMDVIKAKFLDLAKKNQIVLNTEQLDKLIANYRLDMVGCCEIMRKFRISELSDKVVNFCFEKDTDIIKLNKKDFITINKKLKKMIKDQLKLSISGKIVDYVNSVFIDDVNDEKQKKISNEIVKFLNGAYQRQLLENIDIKILVKDTTLINGIKEQGERYLFTIENSRIFKSN